MEKQNVVVTREEFIEFRKKYNLHRAESIPIFAQGALSIDKFETGKIDSLNNAEFVRQLIDDEKMFKDRIEKLYNENQITEKIYLKVFGVVKKKNEKKSVKIYDETLIGEILEFKDKYQINLKTLSNILGVSIYKIKKSADGIYIDEDDAMNVRTIMSDERKFIETIKIREQEGRISKIKATKTIDKMVRYIRENSEEKSTDNEEEDISYKYSDYVKARKEAKSEYKKEINGELDTYEKREEFLEILFERFQNNDHISVNDINIIKQTVLVHHELLSSYSLKIIVLGSLEKEGYGQASKNINILLSEIHEKEYIDKLKKFKKILDDKYKINQIKEMQCSGISESNIMSTLKIPYSEFRRLVGNNNER